MKNVFLETRNVTAFRAAMAVIGDTKSGQPGLAVVWGRAGRGKTVCCRQYAVKNKAVYIRVLQDMTAHALMQALCFELCGAEPRSTHAGKMLAAKELERQGRVVLIDEADRLSIKRIEDLRDLNELSGASIALVGEETIFPMINAHTRLWSRVAQTVAFGPIEIEDIKLFGSAAAGLKIDDNAGQAIAKRSNGDFRLVWRDVATLERIARANKITEISGELVAKLPSLFNTPEKSWRN